MQGNQNLQIANTVAREAFTSVMSNPFRGVSSLFTRSFTDGSITSELGFVTMSGTVREWVGAKVFHTAQADKVDVKLKPYEYSFKMRRMEVDYDKTGRVAAAIRAAAAKAVGFDDKILFDALVANSGEGPIGFDGVNLIDASHSLGTTQSNKTAAAFSVSGYEAAKRAGAALTGLSGEPLGIRYNLIIAGPKNETLLRDMAGATRPLWVKNDGTFGERNESGSNIVGGVTIENAYQKDFSFYIWDRLVGAYDDYVYLIDTTKGEMPIVMKNERDFELIPQTEMTDDGRFYNDEYRWSIEGDKAPAAGPWPLIHAFIA